MIIVVHIPKTAGTQFKRTLAAVYSPAEIVHDYGDFPELSGSRFNSDPIGWRREANTFITNLAEDVKIIIGHFSATKYFELIPGADLMTWVRHPIPRLISNYFFLKSYEDAVELDHPILEAAKSASFAEFAEIPSMQDLMTRVFLRPTRLEDFAFVGIQEHYSEDLDYLCGMMGWSAPEATMERSNANPYPGYREAVREILADRGLIRRIERMNSTDIDFYEAAVELRRRRLESERRSWWLPVADRPGLFCPACQTGSIEPPDAASNAKILIQSATSH